ncbi:MAG: hypothetical protein ACRD12_00780 [Acidimicrobiales bacterium]
MLDRDLDRVLDQGFLEDVERLDEEGLRARRDKCVAVEAKVSFLRRLAQGRLDIVAAEIDRRANGGTAGDLSDLVEHLPQILADRSRPPGPGRMPTNLQPPDDPDLTSELDAISGPSALGSVPEMSPSDLEGVSERLRAFERRVSSQRQAVFDVIDVIQKELTSRFQEPERS